MRPLRLLLTCASSILGVLLLSYIVTSRSRSANGVPRAARFSSPLSWNAPSSLFPPSAVISLTDDNSTFFLARPASFGPSLPDIGLSGQLWVGSGFGYDNLGRDGPASSQGELGCSDVPGWNAQRHGGLVTDNSKSSLPNVDSLTDTDGAVISRHDKRDTITDLHTSDDSSEHADGTDDHLHRPLLASNNPAAKAALGMSSGHADIQSIQESAEIAGKVVLLTRGGCGFLEKVKWVQRRGGTALIVGDDVRGAALVTMYARGDTSNVTIPSLFTSFTTAHLLSSLIPVGGSMSDVARALQQLNPQRKETSAKPTKNRHRLAQKSSPKHSTKSVTTTQSKAKNGAPSKPKETGWLRSLFWPTGGDAGHDSRRPPSSGSIDWTLPDGLFAVEPDRVKSTSTISTASTSTATVIPKNGKGQAKAFVIGVHDWRDPDLVVDLATDAPETQNEPSDALPLNGGSITPGSGDYSDDRHILEKEKADRHNTVEDGDRWLTWLSSDTSSKDDEVSVQQSSTSEDERGQALGQSAQTHDGLWITIQLTSVSSSPFFDALLVLVVSPLVTLSVVYALLLLRARVRRRRWRAPKSVVEQLPVRTYQTISGATGTTNSSRGSPVTSPIVADANSPLLPSLARPINNRPRARTEGQLPAASGGLLGVSASSQCSLHENREAALAEWKRKYGGRQRECVVCLEEYVDGVSKVMSLPCGHEFHADCITPWLVTRRRTCPICKGDVVRSLARTNIESSLPVSLSRLYEEDEEEPLLHSGDEEISVQERHGSDDLEQGQVHEDTRE